jgi:hypothetical protein
VCLREREKEGQRERERERAEGDILPDIKVVEKGFRV